jgi:nickel-dependent lactate racemase
MHEILFDFGRQQIPIKVPDQADILRMGKAVALTDPETELRYALRNPIGCPSLAQIVRQKLQEKTNPRAVVVISDDTRPVPYTGASGILFPLIEEMLQAGLSASQISILVATGTHHAMNDLTLRKLLDPRVLALNIPIYNHDCRAPSQLISVGKTEIGGEVFLNRHYVQSDIKVLTGLVESHFMAGVSGGRKSICTGLLAERSIHIMHGAAILSSPQAADLVLEGNPVHEEALEVAKMAGCDFIVNVTLDANYQTTGIFCGDLEKAHMEAVNKLKTYAAIPFEHRYDLVIGQSGYAGINHYQAAKAALVCAGVLELEGICILATSHPDTDPIGSPNYRSMMKLLGELGSDSFLETILSREWTFVPDQWEAQMWTRLFKITSSDNLYYCSLDILESDFAWLPGTDARKLAPGAKDLKSLVEAALDAAVNQLQDRDGKPPRIVVLPDGPYGIPINTP